jgi:PAS domain S-box-containing protein
MRVLCRWIDPDRLIQPKSWWIIGALSILTSLLFAATIFLITYTERSDNLFRIQVESLNQPIDSDATYPTDSFKVILLLLASLAGVLFVLLMYSMARTVRRVMNDRREYRQIYEEQKKAAAFTQNLINILPIGYHSVNADAVIIEMNQTLLDWLGYTREEIVGKKRNGDLLHDKLQREKFQDEFETFKKEGCVRNMEFNFTAKDGMAIPILLNSKAVYDKDGQFLHSISTIYNFTERKKLENELVLARREAENARILKQLFMTNMSHEIRTPLNAILGFSNLLGGTKIPSELKEYTQAIQVSGSNLLSIVNDILDFEKIQTGMLRLEQIEFDLAGMLHSVVTMMRPGAEAKGLEIRLDVDQNLPILLVGDPMRLTQIMVNLLSNAIKFTEKGSVLLHVKAMTHTNMDDSVSIQFQVEDTGIGIPKSEYTRIFERFTQARSDTMRIYGGTGLGLAIVKRLVELQDGSIDVKSTEGKGSIFTVILAFQRAQPELLQTNGLPWSVCDYPDFNGYHVLLVEDNPMNRRIAEINLLKCGLKVTQATDGQEAITLLQANPGLYDLVFMDIQMPVMDGYATARYIRSEMGLLKLPIIAVTAHVLSGEREKVLANGMNDYLTKPVSIHETSTVLLRYLTSFWDAQVLTDYSFGKVDNFNEIAKLFIQQFPHELLSLQKAILNNDRASITYMAHNMYSTVSYAGFTPSLGKQLQQIEIEAKAESFNPLLLNNLYSDLVKNGQYAKTILESELAKKLGKPAQSVYSINEHLPDFNDTSDQVNEHLKHIDLNIPPL